MTTLSSLSAALADSATMLRRDLRHLQRYPVMTVSAVLTPVSMLLLFVYIFGGALGVALGAGGSYVDYVVPGILIMAIGSGAASTAVGVNTDMKGGIVPRFRTMAISRASLLTGRVIGSLLRTSVGLALVTGVALLIGFRPAAGPGEWAAAIGLILLFAFSLTWLAVALGIVAKSPEGANGSTLFLQFGPFLSSAFVRPETMPAPARWFSEHIPFTPIIDTLRGLLAGTPIGNSGLLAVGWCLLLALAGYLWALSAYNRQPTRQ